MELKFISRIIVLLKRHRLFLGFLFYSVFCWFWILNIDLATLATSSPAGKLVQTFVVLVLTLLSAAIYTKSTRYLFKSIKHKNNWTAPLRLIIWWAAIELFVSWAISIIWYGSGARFDNVLPFTSLSHFAVWTPLGYLSRFVGLHGLSGVVFTLAVLLIRTDLRKYFVWAVSIVVAATFFAWWVYRIPNGPSLNTLVVTEQNSWDKSTDALQPKDGSLVIFPEYGFDNLSNETLNTRVKAQDEDQTVYFVSSRIIVEQQKRKNQLVAGDTINGISYKIDKSRLIPGGEYLPYATVALLNLVRAGDVLDNFRLRRQIYVPEGAPKQMLVSFGDIKVGAGVCSSIIAPDDYRNLAKNGANIFTNSAYLGIFRGSRIYAWQHQSMTKLIATANARTFLQSASNGPSLGFDNNGKRIFYKENSGTTEITADLNNRRTLYSYLGEYLAVVGLGWMFLEIIRSRKRN